MFDKREDPKLINAVKSVMEKNKQIREHQDAVNKKYGVYSRAGLPNELHDEYDRALADLNAGKTQNLTEESLDENKWDYPEKLKKKADLDHPYGPAAMKDKRRKERKLWRKKMKAKAHKEMMTKEESEQLQELDKKKEERRRKLANLAAAAQHGPGGNQVRAMTKRRRRSSKIMEAVMKELYKKKLSGNGGPVNPTKITTHDKDLLGPNK